MEFRGVLSALAAVLQGVPTNTFDLDLVHARDPENRERLSGVLKGLNACYREHLPGKRIEPRVDDLGSKGHHLLQTDAGPVDLLGTIVGDRGYEQLVAASIELEVEGRAVRVLELPTLIRIKEELGRDKDLAQLHLLRHTLEERRRME